ncbi:MAG: hypothetical protein ACFFHD_13735 [Promethearchaeota archaeon]
MAKKFTPSQTMRNELLEPYFDYYNSVGTLILKLDLSQVKKIRKMFNNNPSFNALALHFELHGSFLQENIKGLNFRIMTMKKTDIKDLYEEIIQAKKSKYFDPEAGSLRFFED